MSETLGQPDRGREQAGRRRRDRAEFVAKSPPDGYILFVGSNTQLAANPGLFKTLSYDPVKDFAPVVRMTTQPSAFLVRPRFPGQEHRRVRRVCQGEPEEAVGRLRRLQRAGARSRNSKAGVASRCLGCPYKGIPLAVVDTIGGTVDFTVGDMGSAIAQVKGGKLKSLGVTSEKRNPLVPDWPTFRRRIPVST
jgi:tripartite-type tricarboxylate transporter receptor subunit TctC